MIRLVISIPRSLKSKLDALRTQGTTASGFIRHVLEKELAGHPRRPGTKKPRPS